MTEVVLASAFAWVLLSENLNPAQVIGGSILVAGVILAESARVVRGPRDEDRERTGPRSPARTAKATGPAEVPLT